MSEPLTPVAVEAGLRRLVTDLTRAQQSLADARTAEVEAKHELATAKRRAWFSPDCPTPVRGGATVADRDVWVEQQTADLQQAYDLAVVGRETAADHLRVVRDQAEIARTLAASVRTAYGMAGSS